MIKSTLFVGLFCIYTLPVLADSLPLKEGRVGDEAVFEAALPSAQGKATTAIHSSGQYGIRKSNKKEGKIP